MRISSRATKGRSEGSERAIGRRGVARDEGTHRFPLSVDKLASLFRGRGSSEIRERDEAAKQKGRVWGQKTIGATRAETKATRGDTQYGDASGSLTAHNARSRVNFCVPRVLALPPPPSSPLASCLLLRSPRLSPSLSSCIRKFARFTLHYQGRRYV